MPHADNPTLDIVLYAIAAALLLLAGYRLGQWIASVSHNKRLAHKEQELFTAQRGFKNLYEQELAGLREENARLAEQVRLLGSKVEDYRKKAAGFGGLFSGGGKRAEAMYALLMENEALEEALYAQNERLRQERTDAIHEQLRTAGYRRVLMSQLLTDKRVKESVTQVLSDERRLPEPQNASPPPGAGAQ